jgi:hypothetical protein
MPPPGSAYRPPRPPRGAGRPETTPAGLWSLAAAITTAGDHKPAGPAGRVPGTQGGQCWASPGLAAGGAPAARKPLPPVCGLWRLLSRPLATTNPPGQRAGNGLARLREHPAGPRLLPQQSRASGGPSGRAVRGRHGGHQDPRHDPVPPRRARPAIRAGRVAARADAAARGRPRCPGPPSLPGPGRCAGRPRRRHPQPAPPPGRRPPNRRPPAGAPRPAPPSQRPRPAPPSQRPRAGAPGPAKTGPAKTGRA